MTGILIAIGIVGGVGLFVGVFLGIAGIAFQVETDPKVEEITEALPGNNCGGCGYAGCANLAEAIAKGEAPVNQCPVGGASVGDAIAKIMGVDAGETVRNRAFVACQGTVERTEVHYEYTGIHDCKMMDYVPNKGEKFCNYGCLGFGNCVKQCMFDAIHVVNGVAVVDKEKCKACGKCVAACPRGLISMIPYDATTMVSCSSKDKGPVAMKACDVACIGCGMCVRNCPAQAVTLVENHAVIDQEKCTHCGICAEKCPKKCIQMNI